MYVGCAFLKKRKARIRGRWKIYVGCCDRKSCKSKKFCQSCLVCKICAFVMCVPPVCRKVRIYMCGIQRHIARGSVRLTFLRVSLWQKLNGISFGRRGLTLERLTCDGIVRNKPCKGCGKQSPKPIRNDAAYAQHCYEQTYVSVVRTGTMELTGRSVSSLGVSGAYGHPGVYISTRGALSVQNVFVYYFRLKQCATDLFCGR